MDVTSLEQIGPYAVERFIDAGAFAWVFEVRDPKFAGRRLALKMLMPEAAEGEELRRFESEARLLAQVDHPSVVTIFDFGRDDVTGNFYYVMTFVDGPTLKTRLKERPLTPDEALPIFIELLDGLARLHERGIVHRDIKPANILIGSDGRARLADLGIARVQAERSQTRTGVAVGTALYMSPEQARGHEVDHRSDLFSLGLTLYECLTGMVIYDHVDSVDSTSGMDVLMYIGSLVHTRTEFDVRFDTEADVPEALQRIILHTLRLRPEDRFEDARAMREALRSAMLGGTPLPPQVVHKAASPPSRILLAGGGALALLLIAAGAYFFYWSPLRAQAALADRTGSTLEAVSALGEQAIAVSSGAQDLDPPVELELLEQVDERLDRADRYLEDGQGDYRDGRLDFALTNLERGREQYTTACQLLHDQVLAERAAQASLALRARSLALSDRGAPQVVPESWQALASVLPQTDAREGNAAACPAASSELARIAAAGQALPLLESVEVELAQTWPLLLDADYEEAITARMVATAVPADAREYKVALKEAKRRLLQGTRRRGADDPGAAREAYRAARRGFDTAAAIAPAALAGEEVRALVDRTEVEHETDVGEIRAAIERADERYAAQQWAESESLYKQSIASLKEMRQANEWRLAAIAVQHEAQAAKQQALDAGAERSAAAEFAQAEVSLADAKRGLESGDAKAAELGFAAARDAYGASQKRAIQAVRDSGMQRASVVTSREKLVGEGGCVNLPAEDARAQCERGESSLADGSTALQQLDAPSAQRNFYGALESYARARSAQVLWEGTRPRPPELLRRVPQREIVKVTPRQLFSFAVEASDPNGDVLRYTWTIDGQVQEESGPTLKRRLEQSARVRVEVDDGRGGQLVESWQVEVAERAAGV